MSRPEPAFQTLPEQALNPNASSAVKALTLTFSVVANNARYTLGTSEATFRPTMMFQSRLFKFPLRNTSTVAFVYDWNVLMTLPEHVENQPLIPVADINPFSITPMRGTIAPNQEEVWSISLMLGTIEKKYYR